MSLFGPKVTSVAQINQKASLARRVARAKRVQDAVGRGGYSKQKTKALQNELDQLLQGMVEERKAIEEMLDTVKK